MEDRMRWGRDYLKSVMQWRYLEETMYARDHINNGIDSNNQKHIEFAPFIDIMSEWYARDISKKVKTGIKKPKGANGKACRNRSSIWL